MATKQPTDRTAEVNTSLSTLVAERIRLKAEAELINERLKAFDEIVIAEFQKAGITKYESELGKVNLVQSNTVVWNEEVLCGLLTPAQWNRITVRKLDKPRFEAEMLIGKIDESLVEVAKGTKQSKPFLR